MNQLRAQDLIFQPFFGIGLVFSINYVVQKVLALAFFVIPLLHDNNHKTPPKKRMSKEIKSKIENGLGAISFNSKYLSTRTKKGSSEGGI